MESTSPECVSRASTIVGDTTIRTEILRGVRLSKTLLRGGQFWRRSPSQLPPPQRAELWSMSEPCEQMDVFLSHAWASPGWQKYLDLLVRHHCASIPYSIIPVLVMGLVLDQAHIAPGACVMQPSPLTLWDDGVEFNPWVGALAPIVGLISLFVSPYVREDKGPLVFYDALCINQVDDELKLEGINSLSGFLANCKELHILWTPEWFQRLWCVKEHATFTVIGGARDIKFCSVFSTCTTLFAYTTVTVYNLIKGYLLCEPAIRLSSSLSVAYLYAWALLSAAICAHILRKQAKHMIEFDWHMANFEANKARCSQASDKDFLMLTIRHWHGNEANFNSYVQGTLRERVMQSAQLGHAGFITTAWIVSIPFACFSAAQSSAYLRSGIAWDKTLSYTAIVIADPLFAIPLAIKLTYFLCMRTSFSRLRAEEGSITWGHGAVDWLTSMVVGTIVILTFAAGRLLAVPAHKIIPFGGLLYTGLLALLSLVVFRGTGRVARM